MGGQVELMLAGVAAVEGDPVDDWLEYQTTLQADSAEKATLVLKPTAIRGKEGDGHQPVVGDVHPGHGYPARSASTYRRR